MACLDTHKDREQLHETFRYYGKIFPTKPYPALEGLDLAAQLFKKDRPDAKDVRPARRQSSYESRIEMDQDDAGVRLVCGG